MEDKGNRKGPFTIVRSFTRFNENYYGTRQTSSMMYNFKELILCY